MRKPLDVLWIILLIFYILIGVPLAPFHGDESTLIYTTRDYAYQFIDRDPSMLMYNGNPAINPMDQDLRILDGRVHKYLAGFFWHLAGYTASNLNTPWDWGGDWNYNLAEGHMPSTDLLTLTRFASALLMAVGVIAIFGIGMRVDGRPAAYVASALYALNPALLLNGRRSMMEGSLMGFSLLTVLAALYLIECISARHYRRAALAALLLGLSAGMTLSSKLTGVLVVVVIFAGLTGYTLWILWHSRASFAPLLLIGVSTLIALIVFYTFNPHWWGDPVGRAGLVAQTRLNFIQNQISFFDEYPAFTAQIAGFARQVIIGQPQFYEIAVWQTYIGDQIAAYTASPWGGISLGASLPGLLLLIGLFALGAWRLLRQITPQRWLVAVWIIGITLGLIVVTPLEWQRYYLPVIPALCVLAGIGASHLITRLRPNPPHAENRGQSG